MHGPNVTVYVQVLWMPGGWNSSSILLVSLQEDFTVVCFWNSGKKGTCKKVWHPKKMVSHGDCERCSKPEPIILDPNRNRNPFSVSRRGSPNFSWRSRSLCIFAPHKSVVGESLGVPLRKYGEAVEHLEFNALYVHLFLSKCHEMSIVVEYPNLRLTAL